MRKWEKIAPELDAVERKAIEFFEARGYEVLTDVLIEDCRLKDGGRSRTFRKRGRYPLILVKKEIVPVDSVATGKPIEEPAANVGEADREVNENGPSVEIEKIDDDAIDSAEDETTASADTPNIWDDVNSWLRKSTKIFAEMIADHGVDMAGASDEAREKARRKCDNLGVEWPLDDDDDQ